MAFDTANLVLIESRLGKNLFWYVDDTDTRATIMASSYFDSFLEVSTSKGMQAADIIMVQCPDGFFTLRVDTVSSGVITTELASGPAYLQVRIASLAASTSYWTVAPFDGKITRVKSVMEGAVSDDTAVGLELSNVDVTGGQLTLAASGSAAGIVDSSPCTAANAVSEDGAIEVTCDGAGSTASGAIVIIEIMPV